MQIESCKIVGKADMHVVILQNKKKESIVLSAMKMGAVKGVTES